MTRPGYDPTFDVLPKAKEGGPCRECPWSRDAAPGYLGPYTAQEWAQLAHGEQPIACHLTVTGSEDWTSPGVRQCAGAAIYRRNVGKSPRHPAVAVADNPNPGWVFTSPQQFLDHHHRR